MGSWLDVYQHLPEHINLVAFKIGIFSVNWYSIGYFVGFFVVYSLLRLRIKRGELDISKFSIFNFQFSNNDKNQNFQKLVLDFMFYAILGVLIGGRLGYVLFYNLPYYLTHPLEVFLPVQVTSYRLQVTGIYGMSFHGGLIGVILAGWIFSKKQKLSFWKLADFVVPAIPAGYFFGRIGNFLNGELYGRATKKFWGMYFPADFSGLLRHPSQLYEAFFEGFALFILLWVLRGKLRGAGYGLCAYLIGYGFFRFAVEFFREPDEQLGLILNLPAGGLTIGQIFSLLMIASGAVIFFVIMRKNKYNNANGRKTR